MAMSFSSCSCMTTLPPSITVTPPRVYSLFNPSADNKRGETQQQRDQSLITTFAAKSGGFSIDSIIKKCQTCGGQGAVDCAGCKGTGKNKKNGNIFERWKCYDCQGFGLKSCPTCGQGRGLTPEQRGER